MDTTLVVLQTTSILAGKINCIGALTVVFQEHGHS